MMKKLSVLIIFILLMMAFSGCGSNEEVNPANVENPTSSNDSHFVEYGAAGHIVEITPSESEDILGTIRVEGSKDNGAKYDKAVITVTPHTKIYNNDQSNFASLEVGMYVNVFFEGPVKESYPVQADAKQINVIPEDK